MTIYIDMDNVVADFVKRFKEEREKNPQQPYPQSQYGFFESLEPIEGSIPAVKKLAETHEVYFLTAPSIFNLLCFTEKAAWVQKYFGRDFLKRLIICSNKSLLKGDVLIDDCFDTHKQNEFEGFFYHFGQMNTMHNCIIDWDFIMRDIQNIGWAIPIDGINIAITNENISSQHS